jgi:hypothetical protein
MEVRWAGPGLGKGPQRRRWAWAEEKNADGSSAQGWKDNATSPELLEDFRQAQQHLSPLEWDPDPQGLEESLGAGETDTPSPTVVSWVQASHLPAEGGVGSFTFFVVFILQFYVLKLNSTAYNLTF